MASCSKDSGYVDNWQSGMTVIECNRHMLTTEDCSDVTFRVGSEKHMVRAHHYVLVSRSCVFHAMFCGPLAEKGEVTIPDIESHVFREFLRYVYTDTADISADNVCGLLYTSRKYAVDALLNKCAHFLETSLCEDNVCQILEQCHGYGETDLEEKALKILTGAGEKVVSSAGFIDLCSDCVGKFLKSEDLRLREEQIFEATLSWTKQKCHRENVPNTHENIRAYLGEMEYELRFASMSMDYLVNVVGQSGVLTDTERIRIIDQQWRSSTDISPFKSTARTDTLPNSDEVSSPCHYVPRFKSAPGAWNSQGTHAISFSVTRNIHLVGFQMYGVAVGGTLIVKVTKTVNSVTCLLFSDTGMTHKVTEQMNGIMFPNVIPLEAGYTYTLCVEMPAIFTVCGFGGLEYVTVDGVTFTFTNSKNIESRTSVSKGQIPGLIFRQVK